MYNRSLQPHMQPLALLVHLQRRRTRRRSLQPQATGAPGAGARPAADDDPAAWARAATGGQSAAAGCIRTMPRLRNQEMACPTRRVVRRILANVYLNAEEKLENIESRKALAKRFRENAESLANRTVKKCYPGLHGYSCSSRVVFVNALANRYLLNINSTTSFHDLYQLARSAMNVRPEHTLRLTHNGCPVIPLSDRYCKESLGGKELKATQGNQFSFAPFAAARGAATGAPGGTPPPTGPPTRAPPT